MNAWGALWSVHDPGLPVLIAPIYAIAAAVATAVPESVLARARQSQGLFAYSLVSVSMLALSAWGVSLIVGSLLRLAEPRRAVGVAAAMAFAPPFMAHAFLVFPDTVAAVATCTVVWLLCLEPHELSVRRMLLVALGMGLMPWLHRRYALLVAGLVFVVVHRHWLWVRAQHVGALTAAAAAVVLPIAALVVLTWVAWGHPGGPQAIAGPLSAARIPEGSLGLLLDRERGLLSYAPIYLLLPACWVIAWRRRWALMVPVLLLFLPAAAFLEWFGGFSPAARYLVPVVPLLVLPAADALESRRLRWIALALSGFQAAICAYVWQAPRTLWPRELGTNQALEAIPFVGLQYSRLLPSMLTGDTVARGLATAAALGAATAVLVVLSQPRPARHVSDRHGAPPA
jgi:hypothetical protein